MNTTSRLNVSRSCGHISYIRVDGSPEDQGKKIKWHETTPCDHCYKKFKAEKAKHKEVSP